MGKRDRGTSSPEPANSAPAEGNFKPVARGRVKVHAAGHRGAVPSDHTSVEAALKLQQQLRGRLNKIGEVLKRWHKDKPDSAEYSTRLKNAFAAISVTRKVVSKLPRSRQVESLHTWVHSFRNKLSGLHLMLAKIPPVHGSPCSREDVQLLEFELVALEEDGTRLVAVPEATGSVVQNTRAAVRSLFSPSSGSRTPGPDAATGAVSASGAACVHRAGYVSGAVTEPTLAAAVPSKTRPGHSPNAPRNAVLLVDDDNVLRGHFAEILAEMGHDCIEASTADDALRVLQERRVDLILLDLHMGGVSGLEVLRHVNRDFGLRSTPIVVMSAEDRVEQIAECIEEGADDFLVKPVHEAIFRARVQSSLRKGVMRQNERRLHRQVLEAKQRADDLLYRVFPYAIAEELRTGGNAQPRGYDNVAVMFCDIIGFTEYCDRHSPRDVVGHLDRLFTAYDEVASSYYLEKIKTIGDCVLLTAGLLRRFRNPVLSCLFAADAMRKAAGKLDGNWQVRIGIHAGPVVAGLVGNHYTFDVWGDTVNTAQRVEGTAEAQGIAVSEPAWAQVYEWCMGKSMGTRRLKGKQELEVFRFEGFRADAAAQLRDLS